jgi:hypothetical protein
MFIIYFFWLVAKVSKKIAEVVCKIHKITIANDGNQLKAAQNFAERHVSEVINNERKNMNAMSMKSNRYTFTRIKHGIHLENRYFQDWMIIGELISLIFGKIICRSNYKCVLLFLYPKKLKKMLKKEFWRNISYLVPDDKKYGLGNNSLVNKKLVKNIKDESEDSSGDNVTATYEEKKNKRKFIDTFNAKLKNLKQKGKYVEKKKVISPLVDGYLLSDNYITKKKKGIIPPLVVGY